MDEKKKKELAGLLGIIGTGAGVVGGFAGGGSLISNALGQNREIDQRFQERIMDKTRKFTLDSLNPQQKSAVKRLTGMDASHFPGSTPVSELPVNIGGKKYTLGEIIFDKGAGITAKLPKSNDGLRLREAMNQLVVPAQQAVLEEAEGKLKNRQTIKNVASEHVAAGGSLPKTSGRVVIDNPVTNRSELFKSMEMVGGQNSASALRQGALGSTAPTSSLITNEGFAEGPKLSFNEIAQRLPMGHPSATTGQRTFRGQSSVLPQRATPAPPPPVAPPIDPIGPVAPPGGLNVLPPINPLGPLASPMSQLQPAKTQLQPVGQVPLVESQAVESQSGAPPQTPMSTKSNDFTGPETLKERAAAYRDISKKLRPSGLEKLRAKIRVPGTGMQAVKAGARNMARGFARSPALKIGAGLTLGAGALGYLANNYAADKIVEGVEAEGKQAVNGTTPPATEIAAPSVFDQRVLDRWNAKYATLSREAKLTEAKRLAGNPNGEGYLQAKMWLKYNAPNK